MSRTVVAIDVETTGFRPYDRIITLAALRISDDADRFDLLHRCFDPRKDSEPEAFAIHGWDDWSTRFQDLWADQAAELHAWLDTADIIVAHNAEFDLHYVNREFRKAGHPPLRGVAFCTMQAARAAGLRNPKLDECCARIGLRRAGDRHHAAEDAWFALNLWRHHHGATLLPHAQPWGLPTNYRQPLRARRASCPDGRPSGRAALVMSMRGRRRCGRARSAARSSSAPVLSPSCCSHWR